MVEMMAAEYFSNSQHAWTLSEKCTQNKKPMGQSFHRQAMDAFRLYMIVGGMPQAVKKYVETKDFDAVDEAYKKTRRKNVFLPRNSI
ncbi:MAG: hypothetical protein J6X98_11180 [Bacteroidales bacterium]|nr:hypothetical protein [Bacteroidales bacterium]